MEKQDAVDQQPFGKNTNAANTSDDKRNSVEEGVIVTSYEAGPRLQKNFSLLSLAGIGISVGNVWPALGGSILVAIYNGGPPGVIYEFIVVSVFYFFIGASIAELASAMPSSAGVYLWASVTPGKTYGPIIGFFAGYWNCLAWVFGAASMSIICGNILVQMYAINHPTFTAHPWHVFVTAIIICWIACAVVCFGNKVVPHLTSMGIFFILAGAFITIVVCAVMPGKNGHSHATNKQIWSDFTADIGYPSGFVFVAGMLNGAYAVGTPDVTSHLAEEIGRPEINVPKAIAMQIGFGFLTGLVYLIALLYVVTDYDALYASTFPIAEVYHQATDSAAGTIGLLILVLIPTMICVVGCTITSGRTLWTLARDGATPFAGHVGQLSQKHEIPFIATVCCSTLVTLLACIYLGSQTAFNAFVGSFVLMSSASYIAAIFPFLLRGRKGIKFGPFKMPGMIGFVVNFIASAYMIVWFVIYCFPYALPTDASTMNYSSLIWGGLTILVTSWWVFAARKQYVGFRDYSFESTTM